MHIYFYRFYIIYIFLPPVSMLLERDRSSSLKFLLDRRNASTSFLRQKYRWFVGACLGSSFSVTSIRPRGPRIDSVLFSLDFYRCFLRSVTWGARDKWFNSVSFFSVFEWFFDSLHSVALNLVFFFLILRAVGSD